MRLRIALSLLLVMAIGLGLKLYPGPYRAWFNNSAAGMAYEVFWCLAVFFIWPSRALINRIVIGVFVATCALEVLQLWRPPMLEIARSTFIGKALLGTTFAWSDLVYYALGCAVGWLWLRLLVGGQGRGTGDEGRGQPV